MYNITIYKYTFIAQSHMSVCGCFHIIPKAASQFVKNLVKLQV